MDPLFVFQLHHLNFLGPLTPSAEPPAAAPKAPPTGERGKKLGPVRPGPPVVQNPSRNPKEFVEKLRLAWKLMKTYNYIHTE